MDQPPAVWLLSDAPYAGGAERYLELLMQAAGPGRIGLVAIERPGLLSWIEAVEEAGFGVDRIPPGPLLSQWSMFAAWARRRRPRVLHVNMPGPNDGLFALAPLIARLTGVPRVVVTEHLPSVGRVGRRGLLKRLTAGAAHRAITVCRAHLPVMRRQFGYSDRQLVAIPNAIDDPGRCGPERLPLPEDLRTIDPPARLRIVQVGSLDERKGADALVEAFAASGCDASLWFVGEGPSRPGLEARARELGVAGRIVFTGRRHDLPALLRSFDLVALASQREGMPYVLIEAMATARPIVATAVDGVPELVEPGENGILVAPGDAISLEHALRTLCASGERLAAMGRVGRSRFESAHRIDVFLEHTWSQYGEEARGWPTGIVSS